MAVQNFLHKLDAEGHADVHDGQDRESARVPQIHDRPAIDTGCGKIPEKLSIARTKFKSRTKLLADAQGVDRVLSDIALGTRATGNRNSAQTSGNFPLWHAIGRPENGESEWDQHHDARHEISPEEKAQVRPSQRIRTAFAELHGESSVGNPLAPNWRGQVADDDDNNYESPKK